MLSLKATAVIYSPLIAILSRTLLPATNLLPFAHGVTRTNVETFTRINLALHFGTCVKLDISWATFRKCSRWECSTSRCHQEQRKPWWSAGRCQLSYLCVCQKAPSSSKKVWERSRVGGCQIRPDSSAFLLSDPVGAGLEEDTHDALVLFVQWCKMVSYKPVPQAAPPNIHWWRKNAGRFHISATWKLWPPWLFKLSVPIICSAEGTGIPKLILLFAAVNQV